MPPEEDKSRVQRLNETLYSRTRYKDPMDARSVVKDRDVTNVEEKWHSPELNELLTHEREAKPVNPVVKRFFIFALLFFVAAVFVAGFVFFDGANFISSKNLDIEVVGPISASAGEVVELGVTIQNNNNADLETSNLSIQYPEDSRDPDDQTKGLTFNKVDLGVIKAGGEASRAVRMSLLGSTGEVKEVKLSVEYKVRGSNATFYKDKVYEITIGDAPVSISVESPSRVNSGENFTTKVKVTLNSSETLRNVIFKAEYPYGYTFDSSMPGAFNNNIWGLGDLAPGSSKEISIKGRLIGENLDERTFRFYVGAGEGSTPSSDIKSILVSTQETLSIEKPSISLGISFNGENVTTYVAPAGQTINTSIRFQNNLPEALLNPRLEARLSGNALNTASVFPQNAGIYNPTSRRINWVLINSIEEFNLGPGESGQLSFIFSSMPETTISGSRDIGIQLILTGTSVATNQPVTVSESRTIRIGSKVNFSAQSLHSIGPFNNGGPIPPKVGKETSYTIVWTIGNTYNALSEAKVTAKLGPGVKWRGAGNTFAESISHDEATNTVTWDLGDVSSGLGFSEPPRNTAFQVSITPTSAQTGSAPILVNSNLFSAYDTSLGKNISVSQPALTTRLPNDPAFIQGDDIVQK